MKRNLRRVTIIVIIATVVILSFYDVFAAVFGVDNTISLIITGVSHKRPIIPFAFGVLMGHFFAQND